MRVIQRCLLAVVLVTIGVVSAADDDPVFPYEIAQKTLENGLRVVLIPMPSHGLATYWTLVQSGSGVESEAGKTGFAHFFEHMLFRAEDAPGEKIFTDASGYAREDLTAYHSRVASEDLPRLIELEAHRFKNLRYSEAEFRVEAGAVYGEYRKELTSPWNVLTQALLKTAFRVHPYNHLVLGHEQDIQVMPDLYQHSLDFYARYYRPDNMVIVVAGDFVPAQILDKIRTEYADFEAGHDPLPVPQEPAQTEQRRVEVAFDGDTEPLMYIAFKSPAFDLEDKSVLAGALLGELLAGRLSPLYNKLQLDQNRISGIWNWFHHQRDPRLWGVSLRVRDGGDVASIENELWAAVDNLKREPVTTSQLDKVRAGLRSRFVRNLSSPMKTVSALAHLTALTGDATTHQQIDAALESLTPTDIQSAANRWLRPEAATVAVLHSSSEPPPSERIGQIRSVLLPASKDPIVTVKFWVDTGSQNDPATKEGVAAITSSMLAHGGTEQHTLAELVAAREPLGARLSWLVDKEMTTFTWSVPRANLEASYELLIEPLLQPGFRAEDFERIRDGNLRRITKRFITSSDEELAQFALSIEAFAGTPYSHHIQGTVESLPGLSLDDITAFYSSHYTRNNIVFALAGDYPDSLADRLTADLARLPSGDAVDPPVISPAPSKGRRTVLIEKPGSPTSISFGIPIDTVRGSREFYALLVANAWLGQHRKGFGRLFGSIRRDRGLNYGNYSYIEAFRWRPYRTLPNSGLGRRHQMFEVWLRSLPRQQAAFALRAALWEIESLHRDGMNEAQFERARDYLRSYSRFFATSDGERLGYAVDDAFYGLKPGHLERLQTTLEDLTLAEVNAAVAKHFSVEDLVIAVVTDDASAFTAALTADEETEIHYAQPVSQEILAQDEEIKRYPLELTREKISVLAPDEVFKRRE